MDGGESLLNQLQKDELEMLLELDKICKHNNLEYCLAYGSVLGAVRHRGFIPWDTDIDIMVKIENYKMFCDIINNNLTTKYQIKSYWQNKDYESLLSRLTIANKNHKQIHIDIFPLVGASNNKFMRNLEKKLSFLVFRLYFLKKVDADTFYNNEIAKIRKVKLLQIFTKVIPEKFLKFIFEKIAYRHKIDSSNYIYNICGSYGRKEIIPKEYVYNPIYLKFEGNSVPVPKKWDKYLTHMYGDYMTPKKTNYV